MKALNAKHYVFEVVLKREEIISYKTYPFSIPAIAGLHELELHPNVTFFIGENGAGKSTLVEAIAVASGLNAEGGSKNFNFATKITHSQLHQKILLRKGVKKPKDTYFLRAESFYNVASNIEELGIEEFYGDKSLHAQSHGESFMSLFLHRFKANVFYILDEPEAALSPTRQLAFLSRLHQLVEEGSQFIIATHSPIILAYPKARIYKIDENGITDVEYEETEHFAVNKRFANNYKNMLAELMDLPLADK